jgi:hypothetical protein
MKSSNSVDFINAVEGEIKYSLHLQKYIALLYLNAFQCITYMNATYFFKLREVQRTPKIKMGIEAQPQNKKRISNTTKDYNKITSSLISEISTAFGFHRFTRKPHFRRPTKFARVKVVVGSVNVFLKINRNQKFLSSCRFQNQRVQVGSRWLDSF